MSVIPQQSNGSSKTSRLDRLGPSRSMRTADALQVLVQRRQPQDIVVTTMSGTREWLKLSDHDLDLHHIPSTMSGTTPLATGLALAQPQRHVTAVIGDGSLLMSLGSLVTIVGSGATNLSVVLIDNGVYEVTGGQKTAAANGDVDFAGLARAAGFTSVAQFQDLEEWRERANEVFALPGPRFVWLVVQAETDDYLLDLPYPMAEQLKRFTQALGTAANNE